MRRVSSRRSARRPPKGRGSPYRGLELANWQQKTRRLVARHPLFSNQALLLKHVGRAWQAVWGTTIAVGSGSVTFRQLDPPAQVVGAFFEPVFTHLLSAAGPWRGVQAKHDKDAVYIPNDHFSFEVKTSGQGSGEVYGNRSFGKSSAAGRKNKSGYYMCVSFLGEAIIKLLVGWIDEEDWQSQKAESGQQARLPSHVYDHQLLSIPIPPKWLTQMPVGGAAGIGKAREEVLVGGGLRTMADVRSVLSRAKITPASASKRNRAELGSALTMLSPEQVEAVRVVIGSTEFRKAYGIR